jgi:hypothetical protein
VGYWERGPWFGKREGRVGEEEKPGGGVYLPFILLCGFTFFPIFSRRGAEDADIFCNFSRRGAEDAEEEEEE